MQDKTTIDSRTFFHEEIFGDFCGKQLKKNVQEDKRFMID